MSLFASHHTHVCVMVRWVTVSACVGQCELVSLSPQAPLWDCESAMV